MSAQPIGLSNNLAPRQVMRACVGSHDIAVWRSVSGVISAWENRCPHRGMRLSHGFVRGESLACAYHGWHYSSAGYCQYIPAHPELTPPKTVRPVIYSVVEQSGLIWVNPTDDARPVMLPEDTTAVRSLTMDCDLDTAIGALSTITTDHLQAGVQHGEDAVAHIESNVTVLSDTPRVVALNAYGVDDGMIIAFQQPHNELSQAARVIAHVLVRDAIPSAQRIAVSRWLEAVRRRAESSVSAVA